MSSSQTASNRQSPVLPSNPTDRPPEPTFTSQSPPQSSSNPTHRHPEPTPTSKRPRPSKRSAGLTHSDNPIPTKKPRKCNISTDVDTYDELVIKVRKSEHFCDIDTRLEQIQRTSTSLTKSSPFYIPTPTINQFLWIIHGHMLGDIGYNRIQAIFNEFSSTSLKGQLVQSLFHPIAIPDHPLVNDFFCCYKQALNTILKSISTDILHTWQQWKLCCAYDSMLQQLKCEMNEEGHSGTLINLSSTAPTNSQSQLGASGIIPSLDQYLLKHMGSKHMVSDSKPRAESRLLNGLAALLNIPSPDSLKQRLYRLRYLQITVKVLGEGALVLLPCSIISSL